MNQHIFVTVRFSILSRRRAQAWVIGRDDFASYRARLFAPQRLAQRLELFKSILLPSIANQSISPDPSWLTVIVGTSTELPEPFLTELQRLVQIHPWLALRQLPPQETDLEALIQSEVATRPAGFSYAAVRLDDDDALASRFMERLLRYVHPLFDRHAVSFALGCAAVHDGKRFESFREYYYPCNSIGLALIRHVGQEPLSSPKNVFALGNHATVDRRFPTVVDASELMFLRTIHPASDAAGTAVVRRAKGLPKAIASDEIASLFSLDPALLPPQAERRSRDLWRSPRRGLGAPFASIRRLGEKVRGRRKASADS